MSNAPMPAFLHRNAKTKAEETKEPLLKDEAEDAVSPLADAAEPLFNLFRCMRIKGLNKSDRKLLANQPTIVIERGLLHVYVATPPKADNNPFAAPEAVFCLELNKEAAVAMRDRLTSYIKKA